MGIDRLYAYGCGACPKYDFKRNNSFCTECHANIKNYRPNTIMDRIREQIEMENPLPGEMIQGAQWNSSQEIDMADIVKRGQETNSDEDDAPNAKRKQTQPQ